MRYDESRYGGDGDYVKTRPILNPTQVRQAQAALTIAESGQVTYPQITANQNNFPLATGFFFHRFTSDASRTITGFVGVGIGINVITNTGGNDLVLANNDAGSTAENRILCHTGANITLNPNESALILYDKTSARVRTIGFA